MNIWTTEYSLDFMKSGKDAEDANIERYKLVAGLVTKFGGDWKITLENM